MPWTERLPSGKWRGGYRDGQGRRRHTPAVSHKPAAMRAASSAEDKARRRLHGDPAGPRTPWGMWCEEWEPARQVEPSTRASGSSYLRRTRERWETVALGAISRHDVQRWVRELGRDLAPSSVRQAVSLFSTSMDAAVSAGLIDINPCRGVDLPPLPQATERYLSDAELGRIRYFLDQPYRMLFDLLLGTGLRISEATGLHWERVNLETGLVSVVETWEPPGGMKAYPKGRRRRSVPLTASLTALLVSRRDTHPDNGGCGRPHLADSSRRARARNAGRMEPTSCRSSTVLVGPKGAPLDAANFGKRQWARAVELAEVPHTTPHALRHTYASRLVTAGVPIRRVQLLLGHASVVTTERYAHLADDGYDEVRAALETRPEGAWHRPREVG